MRRRALHRVAVVLALSLVGCLNTTFLSNRPPGAVVIQHHRFFLAGLVGEAVIDVAQVCEDGAQSVRSFWTGMDVALTIVTLSIYAPRTSEIICAAPAAGTAPRAAGASDSGEASAPTAPVAP